MKHVRTKICGITQPQDAQVAIDAGVDAIGLVFYPPSPRYISLEKAIQVVKKIPAYVQLVGLFVNATEQEIEQILEYVPLDIIQFHGDETPAQCYEIAKTCKRRWYKAIQVRSEVDIVAEAQRYKEVGASAILLDAWHSDLKGGTGLSFDWSKFPQIEIPLILAGGLTPNNVEQAIMATHPYAVDVSGGVESAKGIKDHSLIQEFMQGVQRGSTKYSR